MLVVAEVCEILRRVKWRLRSGGRSLRGRDPRKGGPELGFMRDDDSNGLSCAWGGGTHA